MYSIQTLKYLFNATRTKISLILRRNPKNKHRL